MPVIDGVGQSDNTFLKQDTLRDLFSTHIKVSKGVFRKAKLYRMKSKYLYVDLNAGSGEYNNIQGSPLVFIQTYNNSKTKKPYLAQLCEIDTQSAESLRYTCKQLMTVVKEENTDETRTCILESSSGDILKIINRDNRMWVNDTIHNLSDDQGLQYMGMIYSDPNGCETFENLRKLSNIKALRMVDIVMHISGTTIKRVCCSNPNATRLIDGINSINKKYWWVRQPYGPFQWTFIIGTNWYDFPNLETCGFYRTDSTEGQRILNFISHTRKEMEQLFPQKNIRPTVNTSNTRLLKHLEKLSLKEQTDFVRIARLPEQLKFIT